MLLSPLAATTGGILDIHPAPEGENSTEDGNEIDLEDTAHKLERNEVFRGFISQVKSCRENGQSLMDLLETLPAINGSTGRAHTYTRLLKYCVQNGLMDKDVFGKKSFSKLKIAELATFREAVIAGTKTERIFSGMYRVVLEPFEAEIAKADTSIASVVGKFTWQYGGVISLAYCL